jgi:hypothetical protein
VERLQALVAVRHPLLLTQARLLPPVRPQLRLLAAAALVAQETTPVQVLLEALVASPVVAVAAVALLHPQAALVARAAVAA